MLPAITKQVIYWFSYPKPKYFLSTSTRNATTEKKTYQITRPQIFCVKCHSICWSKGRLIKYQYLLCKRCEFHITIVSVMWSCSGWGYCSKQTTELQCIRASHHHRASPASNYCPFILRNCWRFMPGLVLMAFVYLTLWSTVLAVFNPSLSCVDHAFETCA